VHLGDLFQFPCRICGFNAEGPKYLRAILTKEHDVGDVLSMVTVALEDREIVTLDVVSMSESDGEAPAFMRSRVLVRLPPNTSGDLVVKENSKIRLMRATHDYQRALDKAAEKV
jgi:hypothetical protein